MVYNRPEFRKQNQPIGKWAVGESLFIRLDGTPWEFLIVHQGLPSSLYDGSCSGTWLLMKDLYSLNYWQQGDNIYLQSMIHSYLNSGFLDLIEAPVRQILKAVKIPCVWGPGGYEVASGSAGLDAQCFLLSGQEVGLSASVDPNFPADGAKLDYFLAGNSLAAQERRQALYQGAKDAWWLRSSDNSNYYNAWYIDSAGAPVSVDTIAQRRGLRAALILPSDTMFDPNARTILT